MAGAAAGLPARVRVVEEIKNTVGTCDWASPPVVDLRLGITADGSYVVVIREVVQCALLNSERRASRALSGTASQDLAQTLGMGQWLPVEQRAELASAVQKTACDLAFSALTRTRAPLELTSLGSMQRCVVYAQT